MKLITSSIENPFRPFLLLAPPKAFIPGTFHTVHVDREYHADLLAEMQRLRGRVYLEDGAIDRSQLTPCGRHDLAIDHVSWHLITLNRQGMVSGCARFLQHSASATWSELRVRTAALARTRLWARKLRKAVEAELDEARKRGLAYIEFGGWALTKELRGTTEGLRIALATWGGAQALGGCIGVSTVTSRNGSSSILRRIGGRSLAVDGEELPCYYDPSYKCEMEILRFDSQRPHSRYAPWVEQIRSHLLNVLVISNAAEMCQVTRIAV